MGVIFFKMTILRSFSTFVEKIEFIHGQPTQSIVFPEGTKILAKIGRKKKVLCFVGENEQKSLKNGGNFFSK